MFVLRYAKMCFMYMCREKNKNDIITVIILEYTRHIHFFCFQRYFLSLDYNHTNFDIEENVDFEIFDPYQYPTTLHTGKSIESV